MKLGELTWPNVEDIPRDVVVIVPVASFEQHSLHLPFLTDTMQLEESIHRLNEKINDQILTLPVMWLGYSHHHSRFKGTITASSETHLAVMMDIVSCVINAGFTNVLIVNSHGGNGPNISVLLQRLREEYPDVDVFSCGLWGPAAGELEKIRDVSGGSGHSGETETSLIMAIRPELVKTDRMQKDGDQTDWRVPSTSAFRRFDQRTAHGGVGDPRTASAEKGEKFYEAIVNDLVEVVSNVRLKNCICRK